MPGKIQSIERAATILRLLSGRNRRLGVVDIAGEMGLPKGTVHGLLRTLQSVGFVEQDEDGGKYKLGRRPAPHGLQLSRRATSCAPARSTGPIRWRLARVKLCGSGRCTTSRSSSSITCSALTTRSRRSTWAPCCPRTRRPSARCCSPTTRTSLRRSRRPGSRGTPEATITDPERLERELSRGTAQGWAAEIGELVSGQVSLAAPIADRRGMTVGAMGIFGPPERLLARGSRAEICWHMFETAPAPSHASWGQSRGRESGRDKRAILGGQ